jgi:hypothetical protein
MKNKAAKQCTFALSSFYSYTENLKMFNVKGSSLKDFTPGDCSHQTMVRTGKRRGSSVLARIF